jgi:signal transduction histidine kinase
MAMAVMGTVDLGAVVDATRATFEPVAGQAGVTLAYAVEQPLRVPGEQHQLDGVAINLISNAIKFTPRGGSVTVTLKELDGAAVFTVQDTGMGIPLEEQTQVFGRFYRASNAVHRAVPGTGLGLSLVAGMVERHHGAVSLVSREGRGTTVTVRLPLLEHGALPDSRPTVEERA